MSIQPEPKSSNSGSGSKTCIIIAVVLAVLAAIPICGCGGCFYLGMNALKSLIESDETYQSALEKAEQNEEVREKIGVPIKPNFFGGSEYNNDNGNVNMRIPISGPNGKGTLVVENTGGGEVIKVEVGDDTIILSE